MVEPAIQTRSWCNSVTCLLGLILLWSSSLLLAAENTTGAKTPAQSQDSSINFVPLANLPVTDDNLLLVEVKVGAFLTNDLLSLYHFNNRMFVPLGSLTRLLGLAITANPGTGIAEGFVVRENRTFHLDAHRGEIIISGKPQLFDKGRVSLKELDDIYVDTSLLQEWFGINLDIDPYAALVKVKSRDTLPFEARMQRQFSQKKSGSIRSDRDRGYPRVDEPYGLWSPPMVNQTVSLSSIKDDQGNVSHNAGYATFATADLLHMESAWYLAGNNQTFFEDFWGNMGRKRANGGLLGVLDARLYQFGYVSEPFVNLVNTQSALAPGFVVSNYPLTRQLEFDRHTFTGELLPGWDVELYRNNVLLEYQGEAENGLYRFENIPLLFGHNFFRLVFYGPYGEVREETQTFELAQSLTQTGEHYYRTFASKEENDHARAVFNYDAGINQNLSLNLGLVSLPMEENNTGRAERHDYVSTGLRTFASNMFFRTDVVQHLQGGNAIDWGAQTRLLGIIFDVGQTYYNGEFTSEEMPLSDFSVARQTDIKMNMAIPSTVVLPRIPITLEYTHQLTHNDDTTEQAVARIAASKWRFSFTNSLFWIRPPEGEETVNDLMQLSFRGRLFNTRGILSYQLEPQQELESLSIINDGLRHGNYVYSFGGTRTLSTDSDEAFAGVARYQGRFSMGLNFRYGTGGSMSANLTVSSGFGREPRSGSWQAYSNPVASEGALSALAYVDDNANGKHDSGETTLENVLVQVNGGPAGVPTNADGITYVTGVQAHRAVDVDISLERLDDPFLVSAIPGARVTPRPGYSMMLEFPVVSVGEVDGTVFVKRGGDQIAVSGVNLELVDQDGKVLSKTRTSFDGFYILETVPMGTYQVRVSEAQSKRLNLVIQAPVQVTLTTDEPVVNGIDFVLEER